MSNTPSALTPYSGKRPNYVDDLLRQKEVRAEATADGDTDEIAVEKKRRRVSALLNIAEGNINRIIEITTKLKSEDTPDKARAALKEEMQQIFIQNSMITQVAQVQALATLIDCVSVRCEDEYEVEGKKKVRYSRLTAAEVMAGAFHDEEASFDFVEKREFGILVDLIYRFIKAENPAALKGKVVDVNGVEREENDVIEFMIKANQEEIARAAAEEAAKRQGVNAEEAAKMENATMEELFQKGGSSGK